MDLKLNLGKQNFSDLIQGDYNIKLGLKGGIKKMFVFQRKTGHISNTGRGTTTVTINLKLKVVTRYCGYTVQNRAIGY